MEGFVIIMWICFLALNGIPVHEFEGVFRGQNVLYRMTAVTGHVFGLDFPAKFNSWDRTDPVCV